MATSSSKKKTGSAKKPAAAPKKQPAKKQPAAAAAPAQTAPTWPYAIVCIVLSLLAFLGLFHAEGVIIDGFAGFLSGIMGWGYWAFPFAVLLLAWVFVRNPGAALRPARDGVAADRAVVRYDRAPHGLPRAVHGADVRRDRRSAL